jgi:hypothetical protein
MSMAAQYLVTAVIGSRGSTSLIDRSTAGSPATRERTRSRRTRLPIPWCETLSGLESAQPRAPPRGSSIRRFRALAVRAARADRRAAALAAAAALTCPVRTAAELRRLAMEPDQLAGEQCLNAEGPVHEHPPISGGRPASRPRCATGAHCDIRPIWRASGPKGETHNMAFCAGWTTAQGGDGAAFSLAARLGSLCAEGAQSRSRALLVRRVSG